MVGFDLERSKMLDLSMGIDCHSLRHFYAIALPSIQLFESTRPPENSAILRQFLAQAEVFRGGFGGWFFRYTTVLLHTLMFEATAKTTKRAEAWLRPVLRWPLVTVQTVGLGRGFGGCISRED
jgi:hypothetical protein